MRLKHAFTAIAVLFLAFLTVQVLKVRREVSSRAQIAKTAGYHRPRYFYPADALAHLPLPGGRSAPIKSILNIRTRLRFGDSIWDEGNVPQGAVWIRVDLTRQILSIFRADHEIGTAVILYGAADKQSPSGKFKILEKAVEHQSRAYDAQMPYMLKLTEDGVAIHGSVVRKGAATHGCIGVPVEFARKLYGQTKVGDSVYIIGKPAAP